MTCAPDWSKTLRRASYGGSAFKVETEKMSGTRRIKYHEFPHLDNPYAEDLGEGLRKFAITAYVHGQQADGAAQNLVRACSAKGAKSLTLPMLGTFSATCPTWSLARSEDKMGYVAFEIEFVRDNGTSPASFISGDLGRLAEVALEGLQAPLADAFSGAFQGVKVADFVSRSSAGLIGQLANNMESLRRANPVDGLVSARLKGSIAALAHDAGKLAASGAVGDLVSATSFIRQAVRVPHQLPERIFKLMGAFEQGLLPDDAVRVFDELARFTSQAILNKKTANRLIEFSNHHAIEDLVRRMALGHLAVASTKIEYDLRSVAVQARADLAERFELELGR